MNTETPRTDAQSVRYYNDATGNRDEYVKARFARQLERELTAVTEQRDRLAEALRKAILWGDSASHHILHRQDINWTYLNEAKEALQSLNQPTTTKNGATNNQRKEINENIQNTEN